MEFCLTKVRAPHHLLQLTNELANRGEYELLLKTASQCQQRIKEINSLAEERYCVFSSPPPPSQDSHLTLQSGSNSREKRSASLPSK